MKIALVGSGIAGLTAARELHAEHEITLFEADSRLGGHAHTAVVNVEGRELAVDTGFLVFNPKTYPGFCQLIQELGASVVESDMSFSVRCEETGLEYNGTNWNGMFAQRSNLVRPRFWRMLRDIVRFYREAPEAMEGEFAEASLGTFLRAGNYSEVFVRQHLIPMASAVWSSGGRDTDAIPLRFLVRFFRNHGFLETGTRPVWRTIRGGSKEYVERLVEPFRDRVRLNSPVRSIDRLPGGLLVKVGDEAAQKFDRVILAVHGDAALRLLSQPSPAEREVLSAFRFQDNDVVLHTDASVMPRQRRAWASWNCHVVPGENELSTVTYWINALQGLATEVPILVSLNRSERIDPARVLGRYSYAHPIFDEAAVRAQDRFAQIDGLDGVHFCGAYWRNGFHEDGLWSGARVAQRLKSEVSA